MYVGALEAREVGRSLRPPLVADEADRLVVGRVWAAGIGRGEASVVARERVGDRDPLDRVGGAVDLCALEVARCGRRPP